MSALPPEAIAGFLGIAENLLQILDNTVNRQADIRLAEINKMEGDQLVTLDANRQAAAVEVARIAAAAAAENAKLIVAAVAAEGERVRSRLEAEREAREEREASEARIAREREAFRRGGRYQ